jgi:hypothetical protein
MTIHFHPLKTLIGFQILSEERGMMASRVIYSTDTICHDYGTSLNPNSQKRSHPWKNMLPCHKDFLKAFFSPLSKVDFEMLILEVICTENSHIL